MKIINAEMVPEDTEYERGFSIRFAVNDKTCGAQKITTGRTFLEPGGRNEAHYHVNSEAVMYIIRGKIRITAGVGEEKTDYIVGPGNFIYVPRMEVHGIVNYSDTESAEWIFMYGGVPNEEVAGTVFV